MASLFVGLANNLINVGGEYLNRREDTRRIEISGQVKKELIKEEGKVKIETIREQGKVDIKMKELSNDREDHREHHVRLMEEINNNYKLNDKKLDYTHKLDMLKENNARAKQNEEMSIKRMDHEAKNIRDMEELKGKIDVNMAKTKGEIEATLKNISIKEKEVNFKHDENMEEKKNKHTLDMAKLSADIEKSKLENNNKMEEIKNKQIR